jgi:hypothetical protein
MAADNKLIDQLLADYKKPEDIIGENSLLKQPTQDHVGTGGRDDRASRARES